MERAWRASGSPPFESQQLCPYTGGVLYGHEAGIHTGSDVQKGWTWIASYT